jgi:hypothetical protein
VNKGDMKLVNQLWYNWIMLVSWSHLLIRTSNVEAIGLKPEASSQIK